MKTVITKEEKRKFIRDKPEYTKTHEYKSKKRFIIIFNLILLFLTIIFMICSYHKYGLSNEFIKAPIVYLMLVIFFNSAGFVIYCMGEGIAGSGDSG